MTDKRIKVLSIEDNPYDARLIQEFLLEAQQLGWDLPRFELEHVDHLEAALARLDEGGLDVVLTDLDLPDSQAQETFVQLHAHTPHMPIVVLTGQESGELARRTVRAGAEDYLFKREMNGSLLAHALIYAVERQQAKQALQTAHDELERRVRTRTAELAQANEDLEREMAQREQAAEALRRSQQDLVRAQKLARMGSWRYDVDSQMPAWSEEMFHIFGRDPQKGEPSYLEHQQYIHPQDWARFDAAVNRAVTTGAGYELELRIVRPDGVTKHIITTCEAEEDETGDIVRLLGTVQDITDRKQAEEHGAWQGQVDSALATLYRPLITPSVTIQEITQVILEQAQALTSSQHGYVSSIDPITGDLVSHTLTEMFGTDCQVSEDHQTIVFPRGEDGRYPSLWGYALNTGEAFYTNTPRTHPTATGCPEGHVPLEGFLSVPVLLEKELVGQIALANPEQDYTKRDLGAIQRLAEFYALAIQRQRTEKALEESEARYRQLVETSPDSIILTDPAGNILICNQQTAEMHGCKSTAELIGKNAFELIAPQDRARARGLLATALTGVPVKRIEYEALRTDGSRLAVELNASLIKGERGEPRAFIGVTRDVSARKRVERALVHKAKEMEQFANIVSHDLREPLRTVSSFLDLLEKQSGDVLDENAQAYLSYAQEGAQRMQKMIQGLLQYARVGTRGGELVPIDSQALLEQVLQDLQFKIEDSGATITCDSLPTVMADPLQLGRVFQNLIDNAIKFQRPTEPPRIEVAAQRNGRQWIFSVRDNGIGIKPEQTDRLFQIFQRLHKDQTCEGTGIGLAICRRIVERHTGRIWVDLNPAGGSTFYFSWPADLEPSAEAPTSTKAKSSHSATA